MELNVDLRQPVQETVGSPQPSQLGVPGIALDSEGSPVGRGGLQYSDWAECECPDDCPRDHPNE